MIYYILASIVAVIVGFIVVKKLKNKGYLSDENIQNVKQTLSIIDFLIQKVSNNDFSSKATVTNVLIKEVVKYVEQVAKTNENCVKKQLALDSVIRSLATLGFTISDIEKNVISTSIDIAVEKLPDTYKK
jgi:uncharacterized membrane-anchored protein YhcB (DUF1043 family)